MPKRTSHTICAHLHSAVLADTGVIEGAPLLPHSGVVIAVALVDSNECVILDLAHNLCASG